MRTKSLYCAILAALMFAALSGVVADDGATGEDAAAKKASDDAKAETLENLKKDGGESPKDAPAPNAEPPKKEPAKSDPPKTEPPKTDPPSIDPPGIDPPKKVAPNLETPAAKAFLADQKKWDDINKQLDELRDKYLTAEKGERFEIRGEFQKLVDDATYLIPNLQSTATAYYTEQPNADVKAVKLLIGIMIHYAREGDAEKAFEIGELLTKNQCDEKYFKTIKRATNAGLEGGNILGEIALRYDEELAGDLPRVKLETTKGDMVIELFENEAPNTVNNFVYLVEKGFYNGLSFHRVMRTPKDESKKPFVAQGGDPKGDGTGDPGYTIKGEHFLNDARLHFTGAVAMARGASNDSAGSQFYIAYRRLANLDRQYTVFGRVVSGMDVVNKLTHRDAEEGDDLPDADKIIKAEVINKRDHDYVPEEVVKMEKDKAKEKGKEKEKDGGKEKTPTDKPGKDQPTPAPDKPKTPEKKANGGTPPSEKGDGASKPTN